MKKQNGFTLFELMIVVAILAIIAAIVVPNGMRDKTLPKNEQAAIATLQAIKEAQSDFQREKALDSDVDGVGEYGNVNELKTFVMTNGKANDHWMIQSLDDNPNTGVGQRSGYYFRVSFPGGEKETDAREKYWKCFAWPVSSGNTGNLTFYVTSEDDSVMASSAKIYSGPDGEKYAHGIPDKIEWRKIE